MVPSYFPPPGPRFFFLCGRAAPHSASALGFWPALALWASLWAPRLCRAASSKPEWTACLSRWRSASGSWTHLTALPYLSSQCVSLTHIHPCCGRDLSSQIQMHTNRPIVCVYLASTPVLKSLVCSFCYSFASGHVFLKWLTSLSRCSQYMGLGDSLIHLLAIKTLLYWLTGESVTKESPQRDARLPRETCMSEIFCYLPPRGIKCSEKQRRVW